MGDCLAEVRMREPQVTCLGNACCGCAACVAKCPKGCLKMQADDAGFLKPIFDPSSCVSCGGCDSVCPALQRRRAILPVEVFWAKTRSRELLDSSSSGGVFGLLAQNVIKEDGLVVGAALADAGRKVNHEIVSDEDGLSRLQRSKYVQSEISPAIYREIRDALKGERTVLFTGTACQVAGIRNYLGNLADTRHFISMDVICHGVPSPLLWRKWIDYQALKAQSEINDVNFRSKTTGWSSYSVLYYVRTEKDEGRAFGGRYGDDWYMRAFLDNASLRASCFDCPSKRSCGSDITLGDFWGFPTIHPEVDSKEGISAVLCNTKKGVATVNEVMKQLEFGPAKYKEVLAGNPALELSVAPHSQRNSFIEALSAGMPIEKMLRRWSFEDSFWLRVKRGLKKLTKKWSFDK